MIAQLIFIFFNFLQVFGYKSESGQFVLRRDANFDIGDAGVIQWVCKRTTFANALLFTYKIKIESFGTFATWRLRMRYHRITARRYLQLGRIQDAHSF